MTKMTDLFARQGLATHTDGDWEEYARARQARRDKNIAAAREVLARNHIAYQECSDSWFRIEETGHLVHYHPETGEWTDYATRPIQRGYGIRNLVRHLRGEVN